MAELNDDFVDMLLALDAAKVEFLVVGAHALAAHGVVRATGDIDVLVRASPDNARRVLRALVRLGRPSMRTASRPLTSSSQIACTRSGFPPVGSTC